MSIGKCTFKLARVDDAKNIQVTDFKFDTTPVFKTFHHKVYKSVSFFQVYIFPDGVDCTTQGYISVFIRDLIPTYSAIYNPCWTISVIDANGQGRFYQTFFKASDSKVLGLIRFLRRSLILSNSEELLPKDVLTIRCEVSFMSPLNLKETLLLFRTNSDPCCLIKPAAVGSTYNVQMFLLLSIQNILRDLNLTSELRWKNPVDIFSSEWWQSKDTPRMYVEAEYFFKIFGYWKRHIKEHWSDSKPFRNSCSEKCIRSWEQQERVIKKILKNRLQQQGHSNWRSTEESINLFATSKAGVSLGFPMERSCRRRNLNSVEQVSKNPNEFVIIKDAVLVKNYKPSNCFFTDHNAFLSLSTFKKYYYLPFLLLYIAAWITGFVYFPRITSILFGMAVTQLMEEKFENDKIFSNHLLKVFKFALFLPLIYFYPLTSLTLLSAVTAYAFYLEFFTKEENSSSNVISFDQKKEPKTEEEETSEGGFADLQILFTLTKTEIRRNSAREDERDCSLVLIAGDRKVSVDFQTVEDFGSHFQRGAPILEPTSPGFTIMQNYQSFLKYGTFEADDLFDVFDLYELSVKYDNKNLKRVCAEAMGDFMIADNISRVQEFAHKQSDPYIMSVVNRYLCGDDDLWHFIIETSDQKTASVPFQKGVQTLGSKLLEFCPVFATMLDIDMQERAIKKVTFTDIELRTVKHFLGFVDKGRLDNIKSLQDVCDLYEMANKYMTPALTIACADAIGQYLTLDTLEQVEEMATLYSDVYLWDTIRCFKSATGSATLDENAECGLFPTEDLETEENYDFYQ